MTLERARGTILRVRPLTETSLIVHWLTAEAGRLATVAKGARRPKSPFRGRLDLCFEADFAFQRSRRSDLHTLREVVLLDARPALRSSLAALRRAAYATALIEKLTETETPLSVIHGLLGTLLDHGTTPAHVLAFELQLLAESGLAPDLATAAISPAAAGLARTLTATPLEAVGRLPGDPVACRDLARFLHGFLVYHLGGLPRGRAGALAQDT